MSLRFAFLAFLTTGAKHGYELKSEFEDLFRGLWDVNAGQIYTTLSRMQRDALVTNERIAQDDRPDKKIYTLTEDGKREVARWLSEAIQELDTPRDELLVKVFVLLQLKSPACLEVIRLQRNHFMASLREFTQLKLTTADPLRQLIFDRAILRIQADLEWLDNVEASVATLFNP